MSESKLHLSILKRDIVLSMPAEISESYFDVVDSEIADLLRDRRYDAILIDMALVEFIDRSDFSDLLGLLKMVKLMGCQGVVFDISPGVAALMAHMLDPRDALRACATLDDALAAVAQDRA